MHTQQFLGEYEISTDRHRLNVDVIHNFLAEESYWSPGIPRVIVERAIENSLCFGVYHHTAQVGFARVVTDKSTFALLADDSATRHLFLNRQESLVRRAGNHR